MTARDRQSTQLVGDRVQPVHLVVGRRSSSSAGALARLHQQVRKPKAAAPATSHPFDETKRISPGSTPRASGRQLVDPRRRLVDRHRVHREHVGEDAVEPARAHRALQHARRAVRENGQRGARQRPEGRRHLREGEQREVGVHQRRDLRLGGGDAEPAHRVAQGLAGHHPEVLVALHERAEPRVLELLLAPEEREGLRVGGDGPRGVHDGVDVEERAVGVEDEGARRAPSQPAPGSPARGRRSLGRRGRTGGLRLTGGAGAGGATSRPVS